VPAAIGAQRYWQLTSADQGYRPSLETFGNGVTTERHYEELTGYLSTITTKHGGTSIQQQSYLYDPNGNLKQRADALSGVTESFGYDALNRVSSTSYGGKFSPESFGYDPVSNALSHRDRVGDYTYYANGRDWIKTAGTTEYTHDAFGNIQTRSGPDVPGAGQEFTYTTFDLPTHVSLQSDPSGGIDFAYDSDGSRVVKETSAQTTFYAGDLYQRTVPSEGTGAAGHRFMIYAGGRAIAAISQPQASGPVAIEYLHDDSLGSLQATTASDASVVETRHFDTFGTAWGSPGSSAQVPYGYTGQEHDSELGLVNMHGRLYDQSIGQFMSADPVIQAPFSQGLNRFAYAFNSPLNYTDPSGFSAQAAEDAAIAVGAGYFTGLVVHLLTSSGAAGTAAASVGASSAGAASAGASAIAAGAGAASTGAALAAAGVGAGIASSIAMNAFASGRQPTSAIVSAQPATRCATAAGTGTPPAGRSSFSTMATSPTTEQVRSIAGGAGASMTPRQPVPMTLKYNIKQGRLTVRNSDSRTYTIQASSGRGLCLNSGSARCVGLGFEGPVVPGHYQILASEVDTSTLKAWWRYAINGQDWGSFRAPLHPDAATLQTISELHRSGNFFLHGGVNPGTAGCIDCGGGLYGNGSTERLAHDLRFAEGGTAQVTVVPE